MRPHRLAVASTTVAHRNDLGNRLWVYPSIAIGATLLAILATIVSYDEHAPTALLVPFSIGSPSSMTHFVATARAAPIMLRVGKTPDDAARLASALDRFARWHALRATVQALTSFVFLWAVVVARETD